VNSIHKNSQNNNTEKYLSTPFNPSSQNISTEKISFLDSNHKKHLSNVSANPDLKQIKNSQNKNHLLLSQKYLDIHQNIDYLKIKDKRIKSQMHMHNPDNSTNFTSINRINKDLKDSSKVPSQYCQEISNNFRSIKSYYDNKSELTGQDENEVKDHIIPKYSEKRLNFEDSNLQNEEFKIDKSLRLNDEDFFYEQSGNIYCKKIEDFCSECIDILNMIKMNCEVCCSRMKSSRQSKERISQDSRKNNMEMNNSDNTCISCWNKLSHYSDQCAKCNEDIENRSRNITFGNQILIKKKISTNEIGETMIDFDDKIASENEEITQEEVFSKKKDNLENKIRMIRKSRQKQKTSWGVNQSDDLKKDLCIHIPGQDFSIKDSDKKSLKKKYK
jgi:hypothetical protein